MKQYIRLKNGQIIDKTKQLHWETKIADKDIVGFKGYGEFPRTDIVAESDDIAYLFDECVMVTKNHICEVVRNKSYNASYEIEKAIHYGCSIYGAIWTKKGLIYVAKLNENKQWEII